MKPQAADISKVQDAITVLKGRGVAHYRPDIAAFTGLSQARVNRVLDHLEAKAKSNPTGKVTIPWTRMRGNKGGIATSSVDRDLGADQRQKGIQAQQVRQMERCEAEFRRTPDSKARALRWAKAARGVGRVEFDEVRNEVHVLYTDALEAKGMLRVEAFREALILVGEIDAL